MTTVTQDGMTQSQPGVNCSVTITSGEDFVTLNVSRYYHDLTNQFGGKGVSKKLDADGRRFPTSEAAWAFALDHGYTQPYFTSPELRARRKSMHFLMRARNEPSNSPSRAVYNKVDLNTVMAIMEL